MNSGVKVGWKLQECPLTSRGRWDAECGETQSLLERAAGEGFPGDQLE